MLGDSLRRRHGTGQDQPAKERERPSRTSPPRSASRAGGGPFGFPWWKWAVAGLVVLAGSFGVGYLLSTQILFPRPETAGTGITVPSLYGEMREEAEASIRSAGLLPGEVTEMASMETERGRVLAQDPVPGQQLRTGAAVSFAVSSGPPELRVPPLAGMDEGVARRLLESVGFEVAVQQVRSGAMRQGAVMRTDPPAGSPRTLPSVVTLLVNAGAPAVDTAAADTTGADTAEATVAPVGGGRP